MLKYLCDVLVKNNFLNKFQDARGYPNSGNIATRVKYIGVSNSAAIQQNNTITRILESSDAILYNSREPRNHSKIVSL